MKTKEISKSKANNLEKNYPILTLKMMLISLKLVIIIIFKYFIFYELM